MPFRTLLTFYAHENDGAALTAGLSLAAQYKAHLDVLHILRDVSKETQALALSVSSLHLETLAEEEEENQIAEAGLLFQEFSKTSSGFGIETMGGGGQVSFDSATRKATARWLLAQANPQEELIAQSHVHDVTLIAWHKEHREIDLETMLEASARPVMLIPEGYRARRLARASILWNRSAGATHAVALALPLLKSLEKVEIITTPEKARTPSQGLTLAEHLASHGVATTSTEITASGNVSDTLYAACEKSGSDLIIMGAFSADTLRKKLLGSVTQGLLEKSTIPLLMAH